MRRLLLFNGQDMLACDWSAGRFAQPRAFESDARGRAAFERYLRAAPDRVVRLMVDVVEEAFRVESMPRAFGADRRSLARRLLRRHFRTTTYRELIVQGRHRSGRRDLRVLLCALTNPAPLDDWMEIIARSRVPLQGIYSLPRIGELLLPALAAHRRKALLITRQSPGALRQSYYDRGRLRLSRLISIRADDEADYAAFIGGEVHNMSRFLRTRKLLHANEPLQVHIVVSPRQVAGVRSGLPDAQAIAHCVWGYDAVAERLRIRGARPTAFADGLFAHALGRRRWPGNHYATARMRIWEFCRRARLELYVASLAALLVAVGTAGAGVLSGRLYQSYALQARAAAAEYDRLHAALLRDSRAVPLSAQHVKAAVDLARLIERTADATPATVMAAVGEVLNAHPSIRVRAMRWIADHDAQATPQRLARDGRPRGEERLGIGERYQSALLSGAVVDFGGSYRGAVACFDAFVRGLRRDGRFSVVAVKRAPFDLDKQSAIRGDSGHGDGAVPERAGYQLLLRLRHRDGPA